MLNWIANMHQRNKKQNNHRMRCCNALLPAAIIGCSLIFSGCVVKRGVDFGHWARTGERMELVKVFINTAEARLKGNETMVLLPLLGSMPQKYSQDLQNNLLQEMKNYFPVRIVAVKKDGPLSDYLEGENLLLNGNILNAQEIGRIGQIAGASHVICVVVNEFRAYQPQNLSLTIQVIDSKLCSTVAEVNANLDCAEQQVVMALADYLQGREARKMDVQSLDILLRSPTEFGAFASAKCAKIMADNLWPDKILKQVISTADKDRDGTR